MFRIYCCNKPIKCRVFAIAGTSRTQNALMKIGHCSKCGNYIVIIETVDYNGQIKVIRKHNSSAYTLFKSNEHNILYEIKPISNGHNGWYLRYGEYGKIKKCYSNLRTLKLGRLAGNFDDVIKNELHDFKQAVCY